MATVNGEPYTLAADATVADAVALVAAESTRGVAVALNDSVVPRAAWTSTPVTDADRVEVLTAIQGG